MQQNELNAVHVVDSLQQLLTVTSVVRMSWPLLT